MSSYDAVIPVNWSYLTGPLMNEWSRVLSGELDYRAFAERFAPYFLTLKDPAPDEAERAWRIDLERNYHGFKAGSIILPVRAFTLAKDGRVGGDGSYLVSEAITRHAIIPLADPAPVLDEMDKYYGSLDSDRRQLVAGAKSRYHFLEAYFEIAWASELHLYRYRRLPGWPDRLLQLFEELFLSRRGIPGCSVLKEENAWPAFDDLRILGYLAPEEVAELSKLFLPRPSPSWDETVLQIQDLFKRRLMSAANSHCGLITIHDGLHSWGDASGHLKF